MIAKAQMLLDASRAMIYQAARAADDQVHNVRRIVSETKKFVTESAWEVVNLAMQVTGGIGYTDVYPIERALRDTRLCQICTGAWAPKPTRLSMPSAFSFNWPISARNRPGSAFSCVMFSSSSITVGPENSTRKRRATPAQHDVRPCHPLVSSSRPKRPVSSLRPHRRPRGMGTTTASRKRPSGAPSGLITLAYAWTATAISLEPITSTFHW